MTDKGEIFGVFDTTDQKHARLVKPSIDTEISEVSFNSNDGVESTVDLESNDSNSSNSYTDGTDSTPLGASGGNQYHKIPSGNVDSRANYVNDYNADNDGHEDRVPSTKCQRALLKDTQQ